MRFLSIILLLLVMPIGFCWWDNNYYYSKQISITNNGGSTISSGSAVNISIDHASLVSAGKSLANGDDIRIIYWDGVSYTEIARVNENNWNSNTNIWFKTQSSISPSSTDNGYYIYYGYSSASAPAVSDVIIDLSGYSLLSYGGSQDAQPANYEVIDNGRTLRMWGNNWKCISKSITIDSDTILEFDFKSIGTQGEINGMGFTSVLSTLDSTHGFQVYGTQLDWGLQTYHNYAGTDYIKYIIDPSFTGTYPYICFFNDADASQATNVYYTNIKIRKLIIFSTSLGSEEVSSVCGSNGCEVGETYSSCPADCCESDCTATLDSTLHYACNGFNSCSILSGCDGQSIGYLYCVDSDTYVTCPMTQTDCASGLYCNSGVCSSCSSVCDASCSGVGSACYGTDPDCDVSGVASLNCCGNNKCSSDESCSTCPSDCGQCQITLGVCGNSLCESDYAETCSTCASDCGICPGEICNPGNCNGACGTCKEYQCKGNSCECDYISDCCGNNICESGESYSTCGLDCNPSSIQVRLISPATGSVFMKGENINFKVNVTFDEGVRGVGANVSVSTPFGAKQLSYNANLGFYEVNLTIPVNSSTGSLPIEVIAVKGVSGSFSTFLTVSNEYLLDINSDKDSYVKNNRIFLSGNLSNIKGEYVNKDVNIVINNESFVVSAVNGFFNFSYLTNIIDNSGVWAITGSVSDSFNNSGSKTIFVNVSEPRTGSYYIVDILSPAEGIIVRGQLVTITAKVSVGDSLVNDAVVVFKSPSGEFLSLKSIGEGKYSAVYEVSRDSPTGDWLIEVIAEKDLIGTARVKSIIEASSINLIINQPTRSVVSFGETIRIEVKATYSDGSNVNLPFINASVNNETVVLSRISSGVYSANYIVNSNLLNIRLIAVDESNNTGVNSFDLSVSGVSIEYYFRDYWFISYPIVLGLVSGIIFASLKFFNSRSLESFKTKKSRITGLKKDTQDEYFNKKSMTREKYDELMSKYNNELEIINESIKRGKKK